MAGRTVLLLLVTSVVATLSQGDGQPGLSWKMEDWMKDNDQTSKNCNVYQLLLADNERLQKSLSDVSGKLLVSEEKVTSSQRLHDQQLRDLQEKHQLLGELWKLKLENAELKLKDAEHLYGLYEAAMRRSAMSEEALETCRQETRQLSRDKADLRANISEHRLAEVLLTHKRDQTSALDSGRKNCSEETLEGEKATTCSLQLENCLREIENVTSVLTSSSAECVEKVKVATEQLTECNRKSSSAAEKPRSEVEVFMADLQREKHKKVKGAKTIAELQPLIKDLEKASLHTIGEKVYFIQLTRHNWTQAVEKCESLNMDLISLQTEEKFNEISAYLNEHKDLAMWYWLSALRTSGTWKWSATHEPINFFAVLKPYSYDQDLNTDDCLVQNPRKEWREITCGARNIYVICE